MKIIIMFTHVLALTLAVFSGVALAQTQAATAELKTPTGQVVGNASFTQQSTGVRIMIQVSGLPAGKHGLHIHAVGKCDGPDFASAGGHFNPENKQHGVQNPNGPHAGDLSNLIVAANGAASLDTTNTRVSLASGAANSLFDADGSALVIHASEDDEKTDPTGNSGGRIACGVIVAAPPAQTVAGHTLGKDDWIAHIPLTCGMGLLVVVVDSAVIAKVISDRRKRQRARAGAKVAVAPPAVVSAPPSPSRAAQASAPSSSPRLHEDVTIIANAPAADASPTVFAELPKLHVVLQATTGPASGSTFMVMPDGATLGRARDNVICITDDRLSRQHALIELKDGNYWLSDLNSRNGTSVNQARLSAPHQLQDGDLIEVGASQLRVSLKNK